MSLEPELAELMIDSITLEVASGMDQYNRPRLGSATVIGGCRVQDTRQLLQGPSTGSVIAAAVIFIPGSVVVTTNDIITLSDGTKPQIFSSRIVEDETGPHHTRVSVGLVSGVTP